MYAVVISFIDSKCVIFEMAQELIDIWTMTTTTMTDNNSCFSLRLLITFMQSQQCFRDQITSLFLQSKETRWDIWRGLRESSASIMN